MNIKEEKFDLLFLCHEKDKEVLRKSLDYAKRNVIGYEKIFLLSKENFFPGDKSIIFIDEKIFPFTKEDMKKYVPSNRAGWYYQQFLKLYFLKVMGKSSNDNVLIIDADTVLLRKTTFFRDSRPLYNFEIGYHQPYYEVMEKVFGFGRQKGNISGITHHILFQRKYINKIIKMGSKGKKEFWENILENIDSKTISGFSEYDLYFNYMLKNHPEKIGVRKLKFIDFPYYSSFWLNFLRFFGYNYLSAHEYLRKEKFPALKCLFLEFLNVLGLRLFVKHLLIKLKIQKIK